jgi:hypothetical protein
MLVASLRSSTLTPEHLTLFDKSPYDGAAMSFVLPYETAVPPTVAEMTAQMKQAKKWTKKDLWPWVYVNRMLGRDPASDSSYGREPYFNRTSGMDLENSTHARDDFLRIWTNSLQVAKQAHSPGMVVDLEFYLNHQAYDPFVLAKQIGKSPQETIELLRKLGVLLADAAAKEYSDAVLWFLFTDLGQYGATVVDGVKYYPSPAYVVLGLMDQIRSQRYALRVIDGGEVGLEYCSLSLGQLQMKIQNRAKDFATHLEKYSASLDLAGTMILWKDRQSKLEFMKVGPCDKSDAANVEELQPYLGLLLKTYRYNWIYATYYAGYDPFHPSASRFDAMIRKALTTAYAVPNH